MILLPVVFRTAPSLTFELGANSSSGLRRHALILGDLVRWLDRFKVVLVELVVGCGTDLLMWWWICGAQIFALQMAGRNWTLVPVWRQVESRCLHGAMRFASRASKLLSEANGRDSLVEVVNRLTILVEELRNRTIVRQLLGPLLLLLLLKFLMFDGWL